MRVVIVGKTKMKGGVCVGALIENTAQAVRLIPKGASCNPSDTDFDVGEVWDLDIRRRANTTRPHVEDHDILRPGALVAEIEDLDDWLRENVEPWNGDRSALFDGTLEFRPNGTAYVLQGGDLPDCSTGFWILPNNMVYDPFVKGDGQEVPYYRLARGNPVKVKYVGLLPVAQLPKVLPAGTLARLSLAHTWPTAPRAQDRDKFFLQLSGWFY
jgi:hypothetical protein